APLACAQRSATTRSRLPFETHPSRSERQQLLSLGLPDIARALVCSGPHSQVRAYDPAAGRYQLYGPADRIEVLVEVGRQLAWAKAECAWWPGDGLLAPVNPEEAT
ncbi:hypothetical protein ACWEQN_47655, partial [Streptomyces sp. NPDC004129]